MNTSSRKALPERGSIQAHAALGLLFCVALAGCSGSGESDVSAPSSGPTASEPAPSAPPAATVLIDNEDLTAGLKGIDADGNGIRDDIDRLIAQRYAATPQLKKAAEQTASALQKAMEATTRDQALAAGDRLTRAGACVYSILPHDTEQQVKFREQLSIDIEALTANTRERFMAYWSGEQLAGGAVFEQPGKPACD